MTWAFIWLMVGLKIPILALGWIVWRAIHSVPTPPEGEVVDSDGGGGAKHPRPRKPRPPRRGPHGEPLPLPPSRIRAVATDGIRPDTPVAVEVEPVPDAHVAADPEPIVR